MTTSPTLLVLAAGMGSRYGGLKQIEPIAPTGETILDYSIYDALRAGFGKVVFIIRKAIEEPFRDTFGSRFENRIAAEYVFQEIDDLPAGFSSPADRTKPWGTTHAVLTAAEAIHEPFAVINADDFYGAESYSVLARHLQSRTEDYAMVGFPLRNTLSDFGTVARGLCQVSADNFLESVVELTHIGRKGDHACNTDSTGVVTQLTGDEIVSMNMWGFNPQIFRQLREEFQSFLERNSSSLTAECYLPTAVNALLRSNLARVKVLHTNDAWFGVTYREDHAHVADNIRQLIQRGYYPERLWS